MLDKQKIMLSFEEETVVVDWQQKEVLQKTNDAQKILKIIKKDQKIFLLSYSGNIYEVDIQDQFIRNNKRRLIEDQSDIEEEEPNQQKQSQNNKEEKKENEKEKNDLQQIEPNEQQKKQNRIDEIEEQNNTSQIIYNQNEELQQEKQSLQQDNSDIVQFCQAYPQEQIIPGTTQEQDRELLKKNIYGQITKYIQKEDKSEIEVEFSDHNVSEKLIFQNEKYYCLADINQSAFVLASKGIDYEQDEYENEEFEEYQLKSHIYFKEVQRKNEWEIQFDENFQVAQVVLSNMLIFVLSSQDELRIFNYGGIEIFNRNLSGPVICLTAFQHMFAYVYLNSLPYLGRQNLKVEIFDLYSFDTIADYKLQLAPYSYLNWFGYSDDGILYVQDDKGFIKMSVNNQYWITIYRPIEERIFWLYGVMDSQLIGYRLGYEEKKMFLNKSYNVFRIIPKCNTYVKEENAKKEQQEIVYETAKNLNEKIKYKNMKHLKHTMTSDFHLKSLQEKIYNEDEQRELQDQFEYKKLELARQFLTEGDEFAAMYQLLQIRQQNYFQVGIELLEELNKKKLAQQLKEIAQERGLMMKLQKKHVPQQYKDIELLAQSEEKLNKYFEQNENHKNSENNLKSFHEVFNSKNDAKKNKQKESSQVTQNGHQKYNNKKTNNDIFKTLNGMKNKKIK